MPWPVPAVRDIFARMAAQLEQDLQNLHPEIDPAAISRSVRSNHGMLSLLERPVALEAREIHDHLAWIARQYFIDIADDENIEHHADIWQIGRRPATKALGQVVIEGDKGAALPKGLELADNNGQKFTLTEIIHIGADGRAPAEIEAETAGAKGNLPTGAILQIIDSLPSVRRITVAAKGLSGGAEEESLEELRRKVIQRIRQPPHGGAGFDYEIWLKAKFPARAVSVIPDWVGRGSVGVVVAMQADSTGSGYPTEAEIEAMLNYLGRPGSGSGVRPVTAYVVMVAAEPRLINIAVRIKPDTVAVRRAVSEAFNAFILTLGDDNDIYNASPIGAVLQLSRLSEALSAADGEYAHKIISPAENIILGRTEYAIAGNVSFDTGGGL